MFLRLAEIVESTRAEGPGLRMAIWFQGCPLRCRGCCNPEMLSFRGGSRWDLSDLLDRVTQAKQRSSIEGITLLGGEPFAHAEGASAIAVAARAMNLSVMVFSGYLLADLRARCDSRVDALLTHTDILVDGPYDQDRPDTVRRWIGSTNQRIHFLSDRYRPDDECWKRSNTLEIRLSDGELAVNGFPAATATGIWKRQ